MNKELCARCNKVKLLKYWSKEVENVRICRGCRNRERYKTEPGVVEKIMYRSAKKRYNKIKDTQPERFKELRLKAREYANRPDQRYKRMEHCARIRNLSVEITLEQYTEMVNHETKCVYCEGKALGVNNGYALDRKDNNIGYTVANVIPCCGNCNKLKGARLSYQEMKLLWEYRKGRLLFKE